MSALAPKKSPHALIAGAALASILLFAGMLVLILHARGSTTPLLPIASPHALHRAPPFDSAGTAPEKAPAATPAQTPAEASLMQRLGPLPDRRQLLLRDAVHRGGIPSNYLVLYRLAAARYHLGAGGWAWLAGIGYVESLNGRTMAAGVRNDPRTWWLDTNHVAGKPFCCVGPMQFNIYSSASAYGKKIKTPQAKSTWAHFGVDASGDGVKDPYDARDAIFSAANKLSHDGREANGSIDWQKAVLAYNDWMQYYQEVAWAHDRYLLTARADAPAVQQSVTDFVDGKARVSPADVRILASDRGL